MTTFLIILTIIVAILLILIIMVQNPKGGGISSTFGGGGMNIGGVQNTNTFLDKSTWTLAITMVVLILLVNLTYPNRNGGIDKSNIENILDDAEAPSKQPATTPVTPAAQTPAPAQPTK